MTNSYKNFRILCLSCFGVSPPEFDTAGLFILSVLSIRHSKGMVAFSVLKSCKHGDGATHFKYRAFEISSPFR